MQELGNGFSTHDSVVFLLQIGVMLAVGLAFGELMRRLEQPAVMGELIGGIILGPTVLGLLWPDVFRGLFPNCGPSFVALVTMALVTSLLSGPALKQIVAMPGQWAKAAA